MKEQNRREPKEARDERAAPAELSAAQENLLRSLAVIRRAADAGLVSKVAGVREQDASEHLETLTAARLLRRTTRRGQRVYWFCEESFCSTLYEGLEEQERRMLHAAAARVLQEEYGEESERHCEEMARHFIASGNAAEGIRYGLPAADSLRENNLNEQAVEAYETVLRLLPENGRREARIAALRGLAEVKINLGQHETALKYLHELLDTGGERLSDDEQAKVWQEIAKQMCILGRFMEAEAAVAKGLELLQDRNPAMRARLLAVNAFTGDRGGGDRSSLGMCEEALKAAEQSGDKTAIVRVLAVIGGLCLQLGEYEKAFRYSQRILDVSKNLPLSRDIIGAYNNIGVSYILLGQPVDAIGWLDRCAALAQKRNDRPLSALALLNLGAVCMETAQYDKALQCLSAAISLYDGMGRNRILALAHRLLGVALAEQGQKEAARRELEKAISIYETHGGGRVESMRQGTMADLAELDGDLAKAAEHLSVATGPATKNYIESERHEALFNLGRILLKKGDFGEAARTAENLLEIARKTGYRAYQVRALWIKTMIASESGGEARSRTIEALRDVIEKLSENMAPELMWRTHLRLARAYLEEKLSEKALECLRQAARTISRIRRQVPEPYRRDYMRQEGRENVFRELAALERKLGRELPPARFSLLLDTVRMVNTEHDINKLLDKIVGVAIELTGAERGYLVLVEDGEMEFKAAQRADGRAMSKRDTKAGTGIAREVAQSGRTILTSDAASDETLGFITDSTGTPPASVLCVPLRTAGKALGAMYLDNRFQTGVFTLDDVHLIEAFADQAAVAIENTRLHEELAELNARLKKRLQERTRQVSVLLAERDSMAERTSFAGLTGRSKSMQNIYHLIEKVADQTLSVLIQGESGTGKELVARAIHFTGKRKSKPFIAENCASLPETLLESELFGYMKGAFTGADRDKKGLFELADGGTLFLDEVGDMSPAMQSKLLRVLQEGRFRPIGGKETVKVDVRVLAASNKDLNALVKEGRFREDLLYRLNVISIVMPPLRDRMEDIPLLAEALSSEIARREKTKPLKFDAGALRVLMTREWPGNVRELRNTIEKLFVLAPGRVVGEADLEMGLAAGSIGLELTESAGLSFSDACELYARDYLVRLMRRCDGNVTRAAAEGRISRQNLQYFLRKHSIRRQGADSENGSK